MENAIVRFSGKYSFLSNFYPLNGISVEHEYQAEKTLSIAQRQYILASPSPGIAKKRGRESQIRSDWQDIKEQVMLRLLRKKFSPGTELAEKLLVTGNSALIEGNSWNDRYWGQCPIGNGLNRLGELLMQVRKELKEVEKRDE